MITAIVTTAVIGLFLLIVGFGMYRAWKLRTLVRKTRELGEELEYLKNRGKKNG
jgi:hypothetical protein